MTNHKQMPYRLSGRNGLGQEELRVGELVQITGSYTPPPIIPLVKHRKLGTQKSGLKLVEPGIISDPFMPILLDRTIVAKRTDGVGEFVVVGGDGASVTERSKILSR